MPNLDSHLHQPTMTGPTRDPAAEARAQPSWREESFQMRPKRLPISLNANMKTRPRARLANVGAGNILMTKARTPVLVRTSNQRPLEAGTGTSGQEWNVSTPGAQLAGGGGGGHGGHGHHGHGGRGFYGNVYGGSYPWGVYEAQAGSCMPGSGAYKGYVITGCDGSFSIHKVGSAQVLGTFHHYDSARAAIDQMTSSKGFSGLAGSAMLPGMGTIAAAPALSLTAVGVGIGLVIFALMRK